MEPSMDPTPNPVQPPSHPTDPNNIEMEVFLRVTGQAESNCRMCAATGKHTGGYCAVCWPKRDKELREFNPYVKPARTLAADRDRRWNKTCANLCRVADRKQFTELFQKGFYMPAVWKLVAAWLDHTHRTALPLILSADTGKGKSYLMAHLFGLLLDKGIDKIAWVNGPQLWDLAREYKPIGGWAYAPFLFIDDLGVESASTAREIGIMSAYLHQIGDKRGVCATIVSSNRTPEALEKRYGSPVATRLFKKSIVDKKGSPMFIKQKGLGL